jgi:hypothetical protein
VLKRRLLSKLFRWRAGASNELMGFSCNAIGVLLQCRPLLADGMEKLVHELRPGQVIFKCF